MIKRSAMKLSEAIGHLEGFKDSRRQLIELRELEDEGDAIARHHIHEQLEVAVDACENAADVLEATVVENR